MILGRGQGPGLFAIADAKQRDFLARQHFLDDNPAAGRAKLALAQHVLAGRQGLFHALGHHNALAGSQAVGLDHKRGAFLPHVSGSLVQIVEDPAGRCRHARRGHHVLGEGFAAFKLRAIGVRPKAVDAGFLHFVADAKGQGKLGPWNDKIYPVLFGKVHKARNVIGGDGNIFETVGFRAAVAGRGVDFVNRGALGQLPDQGVFTAARTDYQYFHSQVPL